MCVKPVHWGQGKDCFPPPLGNSHVVHINSFSLAWFPEALWGSSPSAIILSRISVVYMPLVLCAIFLVDICIHHSETSAGCRFSTIFLYPKQACQEVGSWRFGCSHSTAQKTSILQSQPHHSSVLELSLPTHPSFYTLQFFSYSPKVPEQCLIWSRKSICGLVLLMWKSETPWDQRGFSMSFVFRTGNSYSKALKWFFFPS